jgi:hypothetical protein
MADKETLRKALEHYIQQKQDKLKEVQQLDVMISGLSRDLGERAPEQPVLADDDPSDSIGDAWRENEFGAGPTSPTGTRSGVRPDEFVGETYSNAARRYLEKVGQAVSMDDLLDALNRGGCPVGGKEPKKTLYISLIRDVRTFVPIPGRSGFLGLRKFYPNLKALKEKKEEPKARKKKRTRTKKSTKAKVEGVAPKVKPGPKPKGSVQPISVKEKGRPATDQTAHKGEAM